jgi:succinyl-diaminopimelate desuccinylase
MSDAALSAENAVEEVSAESADWLAVLQDAIQAPSVNPPGETTAVADVVTGVLDGYGIDYDLIEPLADAPNVLAAFTGEAGPPDQGIHVTFNGHLDTYEVGQTDRWKRDPFSGAIEDGRIHGRGSSDMKAGTIATLAAFCYLYERRDAFAGRVTFAGVSDEETGGEWGTEYLIEEYPEHVGDVVLNGEPSSGLIRFGERGPLWLEIRVRGESAHSALPEGTSATGVLVEVLHDMQTDEALEALTDVPDDVAEIIMQGEAEMDAIYGEGATEFSLTPSMNIGKYEGGSKVNLTAEVASAEVDLRLPIGFSIDDALDWAESVVGERRADVSIEVLNRHEPTYTHPEEPLLQAFQRTASMVRDGDPPPFTCGHGFTDLRFYRSAGAQAAYYGPTPHNMGSQNEYIAIDEFDETLAVHTATAVELLTESHLE